MPPPNEGSGRHASLQTEEGGREELQVAGIGDFREGYIRYEVSVGGRDGIGSYVRVGQFG